MEQIHRQLGTFNSTISGRTEFAVFGVDVAECPRTISHKRTSLGVLQGQFILTRMGRTDWYTLTVGLTAARSVLAVYVLHHSLHSVSNHSERAIGLVRHDVYNGDIPIYQGRRDVSWFEK